MANVKREKSKMLVLACLYKEIQTLCLVFLVVGETDTEETDTEVKYRLQTMDKCRVHVFRLNLI